MSIVTFGPLVDGARGSIGGVTFSRAGSGATVRSKPRPPRPRRERQVEGQSYLAQASALWLATARELQTDWDDYAATITLYDSLARAYHPTGRQAYVWSYCVRASGAIPLTMTPPIGVGLATVPTLTLDYYGHNLRLTAWTPTPENASNLVFMIYRADRPRVFNRRGRIAINLLNGTSSLPYTLATGIDTGWAVGTELKLFVGVRCIDDVRRLSTRLIQGLEFTVAA